MKKYILLLFIAFTIILTACNSEGTGIFLQISQEVEQITSEISDIAVHQVVEVGTDIYARTGSKVWVKTGNGNWSDINKGNFIYNIVEYSGVLYGVINNDDSDQNNGKIMSYNGTWTLEDEYNANITLFESNGTYILTKKIDDIFSNFYSSDLTSTITSDENINERIVDGASNGSVDILISSGSIFGTSHGSLASYSFSADILKSGDFQAITVDSGNNFYITTYSGQIYISTDNGSTWTRKDDIGTISGESSLEVVILGDEFLIIGTDDGYYEMNITSSGSVIKPTETTSISDFDTSYPELATELVFEVYPSSTANVFYLATSKGLWKRNTNGTFSKQ